MKTLIVIPARYGSTRLPGKPLAELGGVKLIDRVVQVASIASVNCQCDYVVATDSEEISNHVSSLGATAILTDEDLHSGSDRCLAAAKASNYEPDFIVNLQGDVPFTPPEYIATLIQAATNIDADVFTLGLNLTWDELDGLRAHKQNAPFSGTTCIRSQEGYAIWFSKNIVPAIRKESSLREQSKKSPIIRHIGMYGYKTKALKDYVSQPPSFYEELEGLEQLRALEAGMSMHISIVESPKISMTGIDTAQDLELAETMIDKHGDPHETKQYL